MDSESQKTENLTLDPEKKPRFITPLYIGVIVSHFTGSESGSRITKKLAIRLPVWMHDGNHYTSTRDVTSQHFLDPILDPE